MSKTWTTSYPTTADVLSSAQPSLSDSTYTGSCDGDAWNISNLHTLRDKLQSVCNIVGDDTKAAGTLRRKLPSAAVLISWSGSNSYNITSSLIMLGTMSIVSYNSQITGSVYISGNLFVRGLKCGDAPTGMTSSYGIGSPYTGSSFAIYSARTNGAGNDSIRLSANINSSTIDDNHYICKFGYLNSSNFFTGSLGIKKERIEFIETGSAQVLGDYPNGAGSIAVTVGTSASFSDTNGNLLLIRNGTGSQETIRERVSGSGGKEYCYSNYGSCIKDLYLSQIIPIVSMSDVNYTLYVGTSSIPAGASIKSVGAYVISTIQSSSYGSVSASISVGISSSTGFGEYWGNSIGIYAGRSNTTSSIKTKWLYCPTASSLCVSTNCHQGGATTTGSVRLECYYRILGVPTN